MLETFPFPAQDTHLEHVRTVTVPQDELAEAAFGPESALFVGMDGARIGFKDAQVHPVEIERVEGPAGEGLDRIRAVAAAPIVVRADEDAQLGPAMTPLDLADVPVGMSQGTVIDYVTSRLLEKEGLAPEKIKSIAVPKLPDRLALRLAERHGVATPTVFAIYAALRPYRDGAPSIPAS